MSWVIITVPLPGRVGSDGRRPGVVAEWSPTLARPTSSGAVCRGRYRDDDAEVCRMDLSVLRRLPESDGRK
ncbi:histone deacetylase [Streptomyces sp. NBRC 110611]|nr:histone deacetylase [Streptomyces sp. NBRC 110611]